MDPASPIVCPECSKALSIDQSACPSCAQEVRRRHGILSFTSKVEPTNRPIDRQTVKRLAELIEEESTRTATKSVLSDDPAADRFLNEMYHNRNDAWRILVSDLLNGRCLDLYSGFGRRSLVLAELVDSVYAVDPDLQALRILDNRDDFEGSSNVIPIHGDECSVPFANEVFDTAIADFTRPSNRSITERLKLVDQLVADDGSLLLFVNGITRQLGLSNLVGLEDSSANVTTGLPSFIVNQCHQYLEKAGYEQTATFPLCPIPEQLRLIYELGNHRGTQEFIDRAIGADDSYSAVSRLLPLVNRFGLLNRLYPAYLVVGSQQSFEPAFADPIVSTGRARSVVFEYENSMLSSVWKYPNRQRHSEFNEREHQIIELLREEETHARGTIPDGELVETRFGSTRKEQPVNGYPLSEDSPNSLEDAQTVLSIGLSWLIDFQRPEHRDRVTLSSDDFVNRYSLDQFGIEPPELSSPIEFFETPVHGDFKPENIYVDGNTVSAVIDWEYGCKRSNPVIDAAFYIANALGYTGSTPSEVMVDILCDNSEVSNAGRDAIQSYCDSVNITKRCFYALLPTVFISRINIDTSCNATTTYTNKVSNRASRVERIWETLESTGL